jgi:GNAT superfamily N-acetyltransferase
LIHADARLARRLEAFVCAEWRLLADLACSLWPAKGATSIEVAGGVALWLGEGGLVNVAAGLAMDGPIGESELRRVEDFYARREATPVLATCPFADPTLFALLGTGCWQVTEFENVLALEFEPSSGSASLAAVAPPSGIEVRVCTDSERPLWARLAARGFSDEVEPGPGHLEFGDLMEVEKSQTLILGFADGLPAGTGTLKIDGDVGWLSGDTTLPEYRGRGIQQAIQRYRLQLAREAGCTLAVTEAMAGSGSQRNMERLGFRVVYPHLHFAKVQKGLPARGVAPRT